MGKKLLYTIGHGNRKAKDFLSIIKKYGIEFLVDVRSQPYSKFNPQFNQNELKYYLEEHGVKYVFMGDTLGGRPEDRTCYDDDGKVNYESIKTKDFFQKGIERLKIAYDKGVNVVIMCSESKPIECHRSKLIGKVLNNEKIVLQHIDEKGILKDQATVINELNKGLSEVDLFGNPLNATSRKSYL